MAVNGSIIRHIAAVLHMAIVGPQTDLAVTHAAIHWVIVRAVRVIRSVDKAEIWRARVLRTAGGLVAGTVPAVDSAAAAMLRVFRTALQVSVTVVAVDLEVRAESAIVAAALAVVTDQVDLAAATAQAVLAVADVPVGSTADLAAVGAAAERV